MKRTLKELESETCSSYGCGNCVLHGCMFHCQLTQAKVRALMNEKGLTEAEAIKLATCKKN